MKIIRKIMTIIGLSVSLIVTGCGKNEDKSFTDVLEQNQDNTCLDDVIKTTEPTLLEQVTILEEYIDLSNKLNKYNIPKMYITEETLKENQLLDSNDIINLYNEYKKDAGTENKDDLLNQLNIQIKLLNKFILNEGYKISSQIALLTLKSKIADSYELPTTELTTELAKNITIQSYDEYNSTTSTNTFKVGNKEVKILNDYNEILNSIYDLQINDSKKTNNYEFNEHRNNKIKEAIDKSEEMIPKSYKLKIKQ